MSKEHTHTAYDLVYDYKKKTYFLVTVGYNLASKDGEVLSKVSVADSRLMAVAKAKEFIVKKVLGIDIDVKK